ncbi:MAG: alanyl-tRNA editing protein [Lachnospiraceae bacterium]|nr:alanyl-tRNA editing protein [Lachnospiraceae bacterium]MDY4999568.1 alanyl-tRNA editing protein [Lachnospiraceae bacterium]
MVKLYEKQSYLSECEAVVTDCFTKDGFVYVRLDRTIFFPEEGGQYADLGELVYGDNTSVRLLGGEVTDKSGKDIIYRVESEVPVGEVKCILNWDLRYERMQNHSGEHVLTGTIHNEFGYDNVGFHLSDDGPVTLDMNGVLTWEEVMEMERKANEVIYNNLPITDSYPTGAELANLSYRSKIEIEGQVRLITIGDKDNPIDVCACCAPHVKTTGEIGIIKVISMVNWKGGVRISMLAGRRALRYINDRFDIIRSVTERLTTSFDNVPDIIDGYKKEIGESKALINKTYVSLAEKICSASGSPFVFFDSDCPMSAMKNILSTLINMTDGYAGVFVGEDGSYRYMIGSKDKDSRIVASLLKEKLDARGGGKSDSVQGQVASCKEDIEKVLAGLL